MRRPNKLKPYLITLLVLGVLVSLEFIIPQFSTIEASLLFFAAIILIPIYLGFGPGMFFMIASIVIYLYFFAKPRHTLLIGWKAFYRLMIAVGQFTIIIFLAYRFRVYRQIKSAGEKRFRALV